MKRRSLNVVMSVLFMLAFIPTLVVAVREVYRGRGFVSYSNFYGLAIPYVSLLITVAAVVLAMLSAYIARLIYFWRKEHGYRAKRAHVDSKHSEGHK
jgi:hypothetical protein